MAAPQMIATGVGVSDIEKSADFYTAVFGWKRQQTFKLDYMNEIVMGTEKGPAIVLMHWTDGSKQNYSNNPIKLVFNVEDAKATAEAIKTAGYEVTREPVLFKDFGNAIIGFGKDPDGYVLELIQRPKA